MLPNVNVQNGRRISRVVRNKILVLRHSEVEHASLLVVHKPAPAAAHDAGCLRTENIDEFFHAAEFLDNPLVKDAVFFWKVAVLGGAERVPIEFMVKVAATVELDLCLERNHLLEVALVQSLKLLFHQLVQIVHVRPMMLAVMEIKQLSTDDRLKCAKLVRKVL